MQLKYVPKNTNCRNYHAWACLHIYVKHEIVFYKGLVTDIININFSFRGPPDHRAVIFFRGTAVSQLFCLKLDFTVVSFYW